MEKENFMQELLSESLVNCGHIVLSNYGKKIDYSEEAFNASVIIFMNVVLTKMWELCEKEKIDIKDRENMADSLGNELRKLIKTYTNIDTHESFK